MLELEATTAVLRFFVAGTPQTAGSKTAFTNPKTGKAIVTESGNRAAKKTWRGDLRDAAGDAVAFGGTRTSPYHPVALSSSWDADEWPTGAPLAVRFVFIRRRPAGHFGSGRNAGVLKASAPAHPITRPDVLKVARAVEDALTGVLWLDDSQIVDEQLVKRFGDVEGVHVEVTRL